MTSGELDQLAAAIVRRLKREGLVVRLAEEQVDEISYRVLERIDERLAPREVRAETAPRRSPAKRHRFKI